MPENFFKLVSNEVMQYLAFSQPFFLGVPCLLFHPYQAVVKVSGYHRFWSVWSVKMKGCMHHQTMEPHQKAQRIQILNLRL